MTDEHEHDETTTTNGEIREKIIHLLKIYPIISPTMLQGGLGPYVKPKVWRPILEQLVQEGIVEQTQETLLSPGGRHNVHNKIQLVQDPNKSS